MIRRWRARRARAIALGMTTALLLAACSGGGRNTLVPGTPAAGSPVAVATLPASPAPVVTLEPSPSQAPVATLAPAPAKTPGTGKITDKAHGFAITVPAGWRQIPLDGSETAVIEATLPDGSNLGAVLESETATAAAKGFALFAMDLATETLMAGTFSGLEVQVAAPTNVPLSLMEPLVTGLLDQASGVTNVAAKIVSLPARQAIRVTYTLTTTTSSGRSVKLAGTDYVLLASKHTYTVTFLASYAAASDARADAGAIMKTFDIL